MAQQIPIDSCQVEIIVFQVLSRLQLNRFQHGRQGLPELLLLRKDQRPLIVIRGHSGIELEGAVDVIERFRPLLHLSVRLRQVKVCTGKKGILFECPFKLTDGFPRPARRKVCQSNSKGFLCCRAQSLPLPRPESEQASQDREYQ